MTTPDAPALAVLPAALGRRRLLSSLIGLAALSAGMRARAAEGTGDERVRELVGAAVRDDVRRAARLLEQGVDPNALDDQGRLALVTALQEDSPKVADLLLESGRVDVRRRNAAGETPLMMAALKARRYWMEKLIVLGAELDHPGWTPLHYAATGGDPQAIEVLLSSGRVRVDAESPNGSTPLMMAAGYGSEDAVKLLLRAGAVPERRNARGLDAGDFARQAGKGNLAEAFEDLKRRRAARLHRDR